MAWITHASLGSLKRQALLALTSWDGKQIVQLGF
jgi:hypothetical protein